MALSVASERFKIVASKFAFFLMKTGVFEVSRYYFLSKDLAEKLDVESKIPIEIRLMECNDAAWISKINGDFGENYVKATGGMVAFYNKEIIHWALFTVNKINLEKMNLSLSLSQDSVYVHTIVTVPKYRGLKVTPKVFDDICAYLKATGFSKIYVFINCNNQSSLYAFKKFNFKKIGVVKCIKLLKKFSINLYSYSR